MKKYELRDICLHCRNPVWLVKQERSFWTHINSTQCKTGTDIIEAQFCGGTKALEKGIVQYAQPAQGTVVVACEQPVKLDHCRHRKSPIEQDQDGCWTANYYSILGAYVCPNPRHNGHAPAEGKIVIVCESPI